MSGFAQPSLLASTVEGAANERWGTPPELVAAYLRLLQLQRFDLDAAAEQVTRQAERYYGLDGGEGCLGDALAASAEWGGEVWCNPPYGRSVGRWVEAAHHWALRGARVHLLVLARVDTAWFQDLVFGGQARRRVRFLRGRLAFLDPETRRPGQPCPVPSVLVAFGPGVGGLEVNGWDWRRQR